MNKSKTKAYLEYQNEIRDELMGTDPEWPFGSDPVMFTIVAGLSSKLADLDNVLKPIFDTYQSMYEEFNDRTVYKHIATKVIVPKGEEFLEIVVERYNPDEYIHSDSVSEL